MYCYFLTICWDPYLFQMTNNALLTSCQSDLLLLREKMMLKKKVFLQETGVFKGSDKHFTFMLCLIGLSLKLMNTLTLTKKSK